MKTTDIIYSRTCRVLSVSKSNIPVYLVGGYKRCFSNKNRVDIDYGWK